MLRCLILQRKSISEDTLQTLDLGALAKEAEGYTPQDLSLLLERAVHANVMQTGDDGEGSERFLYSTSEVQICSTDLL